MPTFIDSQTSSLPCQPYSHAREHLVLEERSNVAIGSSEIDDWKFGRASDKVVHRFGLVQEEMDVASVGRSSHLIEDVEGELEDVVRKVTVDLVIRRL
jgi:hypothetical protein